MYLNIPSTPQERVAFAARMLHQKPAELDQKRFAWAQGYYYGVTDQDLEAIFYDNELDTICSAGESQGLKDREHVSWPE